MTVVSMDRVDNDFMNEDENNNPDDNSTKEIDISTDFNNININRKSKLFAVAELTPALMLCGASALRVSKLLELRITCVISAAPELPQLPLPQTVKEHYKVNVRDTTGSDIGSHLHRIADIIHQVESNGGRTLVHCVAGVSRSASLCLGYLIKYGGMSLREAYDHVHSVRPCIRPNTGFFGQLIKFEEELRGGRASVSLVHNPAAGGIIPDVYEPDYYNTMRYNSRNFGTK